MYSIIVRSIFIFGSILFFSTNLYCVKPYNKLTAESLTVDQFVKLNFDAFESLSNRKLKFIDRVHFHTLKRVLKRKLRKQEIEGHHEVKDQKFEMNWGAFFLGFLLGNIGLIVALFVKKKNFLRSTVIGFLINFTLGLALFITLLATS